MSAVWSPLRRWSRAVDLFLLLCCLAGGAAAGWWAPYLMVKAGRAPFFYQTRFAPAVAAACGHGYVNLDVPAVPGLGDFLDQHVHVFDCSQLVSPLPVIGLNAFQRISRYLELSVAAVWRLRHVAWDDLDGLYAVFGATVGGVLYGLFRLAAGPLLSALGTALVLGSPMHLGNLPHLRDYAKAPFLLAPILIMGWLAAGWTTRRRTPWLALLAGVVLGVGLGFRNDLLIAIFPVLVVLVALVPGDHSLRLRLGTVVLFVAGF